MTYPEAQEPWLLPPLEEHSLFSQMCTYGMIVLCGKMKERSYVDVKQVPFLKGEFPLKVIEFADCAREWQV